MILHISGTLPRFAAKEPIMNNLDLSTQETEIVTKRPWVAGLLALLTPGLGHLYNGKVRAALLIFGSMLVIFLLIWFSPIALSYAGMLVLLGLLILLVIGSCIHAVIGTTKHREIPRRFYDRWYVYLVIFVAIGLSFEFILKPIKDHHGRVQFAQSSTSSMSPAISAGQRFTWQRTGAVGHGDIAVFEFPGEPDALYVFRCVAKPGDQLIVKQGLAYVNGKLIDNEQALQFRNRISTQGPLNPAQMEELGISELHRLPDEGYSGYLTATQALKLKAIPVVNDVKPLFMGADVANDEVFPGDITFPWNVDYYGPLDLPKKGQTVEISMQNAILYRALIQLDNPGTHASDVIGPYTFNHDFYFMMGDNRHNAADSRFRGPVPDYLIRGKLNYVW